MIELPDHPWFVASQSHPELKSRPTRAHPLFAGFVEAAARLAREQGEGAADEQGAEDADEVQAPSASGAQDAPVAAALGG